MNAPAAVLRIPEPWDRVRERLVRTPSDHRYRLRRAVAADEPALLALLRAQSRADIRLRFFHFIGGFDHAFASLVLALNHPHCLSLVAASDAEPARLIASGMLAPGEREGQAEFALLVDRAHAHDGLGRALLDALLREARAAGLREVYGWVLRENANMLALAREMGFHAAPATGDPGCLRVALDPDEYLRAHPHE